MDATLTHLQGTDLLTTSGVPTVVGVGSALPTVRTVVAT